VLALPPLAALTPALALVGAALKLPEALLPLGTDTGMYAYFGHLLLRGGRPYVDFWDVHAPLVYYYWAVVQAIAGTDWTVTCAGAQGRLVPVPCVWLTAHALDLLLTVGAALVVYAIVRRANGPAAVAVMAALFTVFFANVAMISQEGSIPGKLTLLPSTLAVWAYLRHAEREAPGWILLSGAAAGVAMLAKQPGVLVLVGLAAHAWWETATHQRPVRLLRSRWTGLVAGLAVVMGGLALYFLLIGSLGSFLDQTFLNNLDRLVRGSWHSQRALSSTEAGLHNVFREAAGLLFVGAVIGGLALALSPAHRAQRVLVFWAGASAVAILGFVEFAQVVPSFAVLAAFGIHRLWSTAGRDGLGIGRPRAGQAVVAIIFVSVFALSTGRQINVTMRAWYDRGPTGWFVPHELVATYLRTEAPPGPLYVWSNISAQLYPLSGRQAASRFLITEALGIFSPNFERHRAELIEQLRASRPAVIVVPPDASEPAIRLEQFPALQGFIDACYTPETPFANLQGSWKVYVRAAERSGCGAQS
jgi:hypothetical protein